MTPRRSRFVALVAIAVLVPVVALGACGGGATTSSGKQVVVLTMSHSAFDPASITVHVGDSVTFRFVNTDTVQHEAVIGDAAYQAKHAAMMAAMSGTSTSVTTTTMPAEHGRSRAASAHPGMNDPNAVNVLPGKTAELTFTFGKATQLIIGCHEPGHYEAGMKAVITVLA